MDGPHCIQDDKSKLRRRGACQLSATEPRCSADDRHLVFHEPCRDHPFCRAGCPEGNDHSLSKRRFVNVSAASRFWCCCFQGSLGNTLREARPTGFLGVPRVWEKMQERMKAVGAKGSPLKKRVADWAKAIGLQYSYSVMNGWGKLSYADMRRYHPMLLGFFFLHQQLHCPVRKYLQISPGFAFFFYLNVLDN